MAMCMYLFLCKKKVPLLLFFIFTCSSLAINGKQSKDETDIDYLIDSYYRMYLTINDADPQSPDRKLYLDSALAYADQTRDNRLLGNLYYAVGEYYWKEKQEEDAHLFLRKSLTAYEKEPGTNLLKLNVLYRISVSYLWRQDAVSMKQCMNDMLAIVAKEPCDEAYIIAYPVVSAYYRILANNPEISDDIYYAYVDSVYSYDRAIVRIYESGDEQLQHAYASKVSTYYNNLVEAISIRRQPDWQEAVRLLDAGSRYLPPGDTLALHRYYHTKSRAFYNQQKYDDAIAVSLDILEIVRSCKDSTICLYDTYSILVDTYSAKGDYANALGYEKQRSDVIKKMNEQERYETIKELEARYETAKKELEIHTLQKQQQQLKYDRAIAFACFVSVAIVLFIGLLTNRIKRLKKEKEALQLSHQLEQRNKDYQLLVKESEQKLTEQYIAGLESERSRLAKELHDGVANDLLGLIFQLDTDMNKSLIAEKLGEAYNAVRDLSHQLIPPVLTHVTLANVLEDFVRKQNQANTSSVELSLSLEQAWEALPPNYALEAYRIIQEAVSNALKYARATRIEVTISFVDNILAGSVSDDGIGIDRPVRSEGIGLRVMRERAEQMGSTLQIDSVPGEGTRIAFRFNIPSFV